MVIDRREQWDDSLFPLFSPTPRHSHLPSVIPAYPPLFSPTPRHSREGGNPDNMKMYSDMRFEISGLTKREKLDEK